jgi:hypothetical protein
MPFHTIIQQTPEYDQRDRKLLTAAKEFGTGTAYTQTVYSSTQIWDQLLETSQLSLQSCR